MNRLSKFAERIIDAIMDIPGGEILLLIALYVAVLLLLGAD